MKNYYATETGYAVEDDIYEGGILRYEANSQPYYDLFKFSSNQQRDEFVNGSNNRQSITVKEIKSDSHLNHQLQSQR